VYKLIYTPQAEKQLTEIANNIYDLSGEYKLAEKYVLGIKEALDHKRSFPKTSPLICVENPKLKGLRKVHFKRYYAYYVLDENDHVMYVTAIVYDGMDQEAFFDSHI